MRDICSVIDEILSIPGLPERAAEELEALSIANATRAPEEQVPGAWREGACILATRLVDALPEVRLRAYAIWTGRGAEGKADA